MSLALQYIALNHMNAEIGSSCTFAHWNPFFPACAPPPAAPFSSSDLNLFNEPARLWSSDRWHGFLARAKLKDLLHITWFPGSLPAAGRDVIVLHAEQVNSPVFEFTTFWLRNSMNSLAGKCYCLTSRQLQKQSCFPLCIQDWKRESQLYVTSLLFRMLEQQGLCKINADWTLSVLPACCICSFNRTCSHKLK